MFKALLSKVKGFISKTLNIKEYGVAASLLLTLLSIISIALLLLAFGLLIYYVKENLF